MYFWKIEGLKQQLRAGRISDNEAFVYFIVVLAFDTLLLTSWGAFPLESTLNVWDYVEMVGYLAIVIAGTVLLYINNGGTKGKHFFARYFPLLWVVGIRFSAVVILLAIAYTLFLMTSPTENTDTTWYETSAYLITMALYYWRLYVHIGDVASTGHA